HERRLLIRVRHARGGRDLRPGSTGDRPHALRRDPALHRRRHRRRPRGTMVGYPPHTLCARRGTGCRYDRPGCGRRRRHRVRHGRHALRDADAHVERHGQAPCAVRSGTPPAGRRNRRPGGLAERDTALYRSRHSGHRPGVPAAAGIRRLDRQTGVYRRLTRQWLQRRRSDAAVLYRRHARQRPGARSVLNSEPHDERFCRPAPVHPDVGPCPRHPSVAPSQSPAARPPTADAGTPRRHPPGVAVPCRQRLPAGASRVPFRTPCATARGAGRAVAMRAAARNRGQGDARKRRLAAHQ
nr:hypothetical protein [Tanacetum cinerariifolium]